MTENIGECLIDLRYLRLPPQTLSEPCLDHAEHCLDIGSCVVVRQEFSRW